VPSPLKIIDPLAAPVEATGTDLPPVPDERLTAPALRARFQKTLDWLPETYELRERGRADPRIAAVLIALVDRRDGLTVLFTQRTAHLSAHAGQISFPGGSAEPHDADAVATALRESHEEIGLLAEHVEILGCLPDYLTGTGFRVTPVVGLVHPPFTLSADDAEVAEVFEVPLAFLMNPSNHEVRLFRTGDVARRFFAMPYPREAGGEHFIWGATAAMVRNLYRFLSV
jgi:8-oxo-dGTP pyrophosphatase MutT (NUDIX family)